MSERTFYAEAALYTDDLRKLAWRPEGSPRYLYGFVSDGQPEPTGVNDTAELAASQSVNYSTVAMIDTFGIPLTEANLPETSLISDLVVGAAGNIDADAVLDKWVIDSMGLLVPHESDL